MSGKLDALISDIEKCLSTRELSKALELIRLPASGIKSDNRAMTLVFGSSELDVLCHKVGNLALRECADLTTINHKRFLFVSSELYASGGHTALLEDFARVLTPNECLFLLTDPDDKTEIKIIDERFRNLGADIEFGPRKTSLKTKLLWTLNAIKRTNPDWTFFAGNPDDPICVAAMQEEICGKIAFVHHVDHHFTLGLHATADLHIDFRGVGQQNCKNQLHIPNTCVVPLTARDRGTKKTIPKVLESSALITCSSGNNKFEIPYSYKLEDVIPRIIETTGGKHIHVGLLSESTRLLIEQGLRERKLSVESVQFVPWVNSLWQFVLDEKVDLYLDSFPICGCKAVTEIMGAGLPVIVHRSYISDLLSNVNFVDASAPVWETIEELILFLRGVTPEVLTFLGTKSREYFEIHHSETIFKNILLKALQSHSSNKKRFKSSSSKNSFRHFTDQNCIFETEPQIADALYCGYYVFQSLGLDKSTFDQIAQKHFSIHGTKLGNLSHEASGSLKTFRFLNSVWPFWVNGNLDKKKLSELLFSASLLKQEGRTNNLPFTEGKNRLVTRAKFLAKKIRNHL